MRRDGPSGFDMKCRNVARTFQRFNLLLTQRFAQLISQKNKKTIACGIDVANGNNN